MRTCEEPSPLRNAVGKALTATVSIAPARVQNVRRIPACDKALASFLAVRSNCCQRFRASLQFRAVRGFWVPQHGCPRTSIEERGGGPHELSSFGPGSSRASSIAQPAVALRTFAVAALVALACLTFVAPGAFAQDGAGNPTTPSSDSSSGIGTPASTPSDPATSGSGASTGQGAPESSPPPSSPPATEGPPADGASANDGTTYYEPSSPPSGTSAGGDERTDAAAHGVGSPSSLDTLVSVEDDQPAGGRSTTPSPQSTPNSPPAAVTAPTDEDVFMFSGLDTGGMKALLSSDWCDRDPCSATSSVASGHFVFASQLPHHSTAQQSEAAVVSKRSVTSLLDAPSPTRGPFFGLGGGGGGAAIAFTLISLLAVMALRPVRADWTTSLVSTATWRPSVYVPPIESPG
jgi:hypothetical protein